MLKQVFDFMHQTDRPHVHGKTRAKILALVKEIDAVYKQHVRAPTGMVCDICGKGDTDSIHKVKDVVNGFEHREHMSPRLCYGHACGWNTSYTKLENQRKYQLLGLNKRVFSDVIEMARTVFDESVLLDEEIDLHFAQYLAKQLQKTLREKA
jgi:hypothetical protein